MLCLHALNVKLIAFRNSSVFILVGDASKTRIKEDIAKFCAAQDVVFVLMSGGLIWGPHPFDVYVFAWEAPTQEKIA